METLLTGNNFPNLVYFAVTWALRTCRAARGPVDVRYGPTFPHKLNSNLKNQPANHLSRCLPAKWRFTACLRLESFHIWAIHYFIFKSLALFFFFGKFDV